MKSRRGLTIIELLVVMAIGGVVFGLVIDAFIQTDRASTRLVMHQQMRQEAVVISNTIEKALRQGVYEFPAMGGAAPTTAAGGGTTVSEIPRSLSVTGMTTAVLQSSNETAAPTSPTQSPTIMAPSANPGGDPNTTVPASIQSLFTTKTVERNSTGTTGSASQVFQLERLRLATLAFGVKSGMDYEITSDGAPGSYHVVVRDGSTQAAKKLGGMSDRFQSVVAYRYAETFNGLDAVWATEATRPRLIEYSVMVWPIGSKYPTYDAAIADDGSRLRFKLTSAVAIP